MKARPLPPGTRFATLANKPTKTAGGGGTKRAKKNALEVLRLEDPQLALLCPPATYIDCRSPITVVGDNMIRTGQALFQLTYTGRAAGFGADKRVLWSMPSEQVPHLGALRWPQIKETKRTDIEMADANGRIVVISFFRVPREWAARRPGERLIALGRLARYGSKLVLEVTKEAPERAIGRIWPQYAGIPGQIAGERVEAMVNACVDSDMATRKCVSTILGETGLNDGELMESCGTSADNGFASSTDVLRALHRPASVEEGELALEYAKRISAIGIQAAALRHHKRAPHPKSPLAINPNDLNRILGVLDKELTQGQRAVVDEVIERLAQPKPLNGLLSGDVGTGKTLSFLVPAIAAHLAGARVAIITPRTLLADQISNELLRWDGLAKVERVNTGGRIVDPSAILVSTTGLASTAERESYVPQFLICDEQHKFSAESREALVGAATHVLEVSATPVPRSLAAALYEGMEILNLRECPVKKTIYSDVLDMNTRGEVIAGIRQVIGQGGIAAVVYPKINTADGSESQSVTRAFESFDKAFPGKCVMLHGEMSDDEMRKNIKMLRAGERQLVIASTVLEVGIDIPSINFMAVRDADCFGVSQLHQLRGRLARNGGTGFFMMVVEDLAKTPASSVERLEAVAKTLDGYKLAEMDLVQRGFGELDGTAQSGASQTIFRNIPLGVKNFLARQLKTIAPQPSTRSYNESVNLARTRQEQLI